MFTLALPATELPAEVERYPHLAFVVGVALAQTVRGLIGATNQAGIQLKWPNDVVRRSSQVVGILIETLHSRSQPWVLPLVLALMLRLIGIVLRMRIAERATCLTRVAGRADGESEEVLAGVFARAAAAFVCVARGLRMLVGTVAPALLVNWQTCSHSARARRSELVGVCEGVDSWGHLLLRDEKQLHSITACEILSWQSSG